MHCFRFDCETWIMNLTLKQHSNRLSVGQRVKYRLIQRDKGRMKAIHVCGLGALNHSKSDDSSNKESEASCIQDRGTWDRLDQGGDDQQNGGLGRNRDCIQASRCKLSQHAEWCFRGESGFEKYCDTDATALETAYLTGQTNVILMTGRHRVDISDMKQKNMTTGFVRDVRRQSISVNPHLVPLVQGVNFNVGVSINNTLADGPAWGSKVPVFTLKRSGKFATKYSIIGDPGTKHTKEVQEFNIAYGHFFRLMGFRRNQSQQIAIAQVDVYVNPLLAGQFQQELAGLSGRGRPCEEDWVFHGTGSTENVAKIMLEGFKVGGSDGVPVVNGTAYGNGVYTAKGPDTPMTYGKATGQIILARALRGRRGDCVSDDADSWEPSKDWVVFRRGQQLLPVYVVHYSCDSGSKVSKDVPAAGSQKVYRSCHRSSSGAPAGVQVGDSGQTTSGSSEGKTNLDCCVM